MNNIIILNTFIREHQTSINFYIEGFIFDDFKNDLTMFRNRLFGLENIQRKNNSFQNVSYILIYAFIPSIFYF